MLKGKTKSGFKYEISDSAFNNYELLEVFAEVDSNPLMIPKVVQMLLGTEQKKSLFEHLRNKEGIVPTDKIGEELAEILQNEEVKK